VNGLSNEQDVARLYADRGYDVRAADDVPEALAGVDLVARRGDETIYVEIKRARHGAASDDPDLRLTALAEAAASLPGARLDVVILPADPSRQPAEDADAVRRVAAAAVRLAAGGDVPDDVRGQAALVLACAAAEGALRLLAARSRLDADPAAGLAALAAQLRSEGLLWSGHWDVIDRAAAARDAIVHGLSPEPYDPELLARLSGLTSAVAEQAPMTADDLVDWFAEHYKDPADGVPYDSGEAGYQYVHGGPYDARDVLENQFDFVPPAVIDEAIGRIEADGTEWVEVDTY
jgi:Holliday junction resolvase-like predicted endonuclease